MGLDASTLRNEICVGGNAGLILGGLLLEDDNLLEVGDGGGDIAFA